jgi:hypothetical protein
MNNLKVGDNIYVTNRHGSKIVEIIRTTEKRAFSSDMQFKLEYETSIQAIGENIWDATQCRIATPEFAQDYNEKLRAKIELGKLLAQIEELKFNTLTTDQLNQILNLIKTF